MQNLCSVSGVGLARWPGIPPHGGVAQGGLLVPVSGVDDAEGRVREQVGELKIRGNERDGTPKRDMTQRWNNFYANSQNRLALEPNISHA